MDKAVIFNVYDFVSFEFCKTLLNHGVEVKGIYIKDPKEQFLDEKQLEVGRNANYKEISLDDFDMRDTEKTTVIISLYDLYMLHKESHLNEDSFKIMADLQFENLVLILPAQMLNNSLRTEEFSEIQTYLNLITRKNRRVHIFYLPTVYGPWQPATFLFQQTILANMNRAEEFKGIRESTIDCIYIEDATRTMLSICKSSKRGNYLIESGLENFWMQCAEFIQVKNIPAKRGERFELSEKIEKVAVKNATSLTDSFTRQINHVGRLFSMET